MGVHSTTIVALATAEPLLIAVIGLLSAVIVGLGAMAILLRRRAAREHVAPAEAPRVTALALQASPPPRPRARPVVRGGGGGGGGLAMATSTAMVCPTCRTEYHGMTYCTRDARRLVPPEDMLGAAVRGSSGRSAGLVCMACRRAYEPGLRSCPHDGTELVPFPVYNATRPRRARLTEPANVIARICPVCASKYDLNARFCGHDAGALIVIN